MALKEPLQGNSDLGEVWTAKGDRRRQKKDTPCAKVAQHKNKIMKDRRSNRVDGRIRPGINLQVEPEKDGRSERDVGWIRKAALV
jgi:hypothetical protein